MSERIPGSTPSDEFHADPTTISTAMAVLTADPEVAVTLIREDGKVLWGNAQAARLWVRPDATPDDYAGKNIQDLQPKEWNAARVELFERARASERPVVIRLMWNGKQYFSLTRLVKASPAELDRFLIVTRHVPSGESDKPPIDPNYEVIEAEAVGLGHLDVLTAREIEVLALVGQGLSTREIARTLSRSEKTIENHRYAIGKKLDASSPVRLAEIARQAGLSVKDADRRRVS